MYEHLMKESKKKLVERVEEEIGNSSAFFKEKQRLAELLRVELSQTQKLKLVAADFGRFLVTMNVKAVEYPKTFRTNCGMAPDMLIETMEQMFDRFMETYVPK